MTGNPAALASALIKVSDGLVAIPKADLRAASVHDAFHLLPAARENASRCRPRTRRCAPASSASSASSGPCSAS